ncbi:hypothetical protein Plhal304r1_c009g0035771 [Plasmopara halstedii]
MKVPGFSIRFRHSYDFCCQGCDVLGGLSSHSLNKFVEENFPTRLTSWQRGSNGGES